MNNLQIHRPESPDVDDVLRKFFRQEMPTPWPKCPTPAPNPRLISLWSRRLPRVALAASVALLLTGYLSLAHWFPQDTVGDSAMPGGPNIADKKFLRPGKVEQIRTPAGNDAELREETADGDQTITIQIQALPTTKGRR